MVKTFLFVGTGEFEGQSAYGSLEFVRAGKNFRGEKARSEFLVNFDCKFVSSIQGNLSLDWSTMTDKGVCCYSFRDSIPEFVQVAPKDLQAMLEHMECLKNEVR